MKIKLASDWTGVVSVKAAAIKLAEEGHEVEIIYPGEIAGLPEGVHIYQDLNLLSEVEDSLFVAITPGAMPILRRFFGDRIKRQVGPEGLAYQFVSNPSFTRDILRNAGVTLAEDVEEVTNPTRVCLWVAGDHVWPVGFAYSELGDLAPRGGPFSFSGITVTPVWSKRLAKLAEGIRLGCAAIKYSGPIFLEIYWDPERKVDVVQSIRFDYPNGFLPALLSLFGPNQFGGWLARLQQGNYIKKPKLRENVSVAQIRLQSPEWFTDNLPEWACYDMPYDQTQQPDLWPFSLRLRTPTEESYPEIVVHLDAKSKAGYTYEQLESRRIPLYRLEEVTKPNQPEEVKVNE